MTDEVHRRLSAALRAQALSTGSPAQPAPPPAHAKPRLSASAVLVLAVLLGVLAGGLAGLISAW